MKWRPVLNALKIQTELLFFVIVTVAILAQGAHWAVVPAQAYAGTVRTATQAERSQLLAHGCALADASCASKVIDSCGVRTHALTEWRLEPPP